MKTTFKWLLALGLGLTIVGSSAVVASAATTGKSLASVKTSYVRTKKPLFFGAYRKTAHGLKPIKVKAGTLLYVKTILSHRTKTGWQYTANLTFGSVHYQRLHKLVYKSKPIPYTTANLTPAKLNPLRTLVFRSGDGFAMQGKRTYLHTSAFYLTVDNYLQTYSAAAMKQADPHWGNYASTDGLETKRPTAAVRVTRVSQKGNFTTIDYRHAIRGLPNRRLASHHYQLVIQNLQTNGGQSFIPTGVDGYEISASWQNYAVNSQDYFVGSSEGVN